MTSGPSSPTHSAKPTSQPSQSAFRCAASPPDAVAAIRSSRPIPRPARAVETPITDQGYKHLVKLTIDTDGKHGTKTAQLTVTDNHPFWTPDLGRWINAGDLKPGMWLRTSAGTWIQITTIKHKTAPNQRVHNLTVQGTHTYYALAGATPVLVHNCGYRR